MKGFCAICGTEGEIAVIASLGPGEPAVRQCTACQEPARALYGPERTYEGAGGHLGTAELTSAMHRVMGDVEYERQMRDNDHRSRAPAPAADADTIEWVNHVREGQRRHRTGAGRSLAKEGRGVRMIPMRRRGE